MVVGWWGGGRHGRFLKVLKGGFFWKVFSHHSLKVGFFSRFLAHLSLKVGFLKVFIQILPGTVDFPRIAKLDFPRIREVP